MSRLYLRCVLCGRQQAEGLISGAAWGRLELPARAAVIHHPAVRGSTVRACPTCSGTADWQERVLATLGLAPNAGFSLRVDSA